MGQPTVLPAQGATQDISRDQWIKFLDEFTRQNRGAHAQLEVLGADPGRFVEIEDRPFALVLTSPLSRASETAALAGFGDRAIADPDLREWDYGSLEGRLTEEIRADYPGWTVWRGPWPPDGETGDQVASRAEAIVRAREAGLG